MLMIKNLFLKAYDKRNNIETSLNSIHRNEGFVNMNSFEKLFTETLKVNDHSSKLKKGPIGLKNGHNNCYMNSAVQAMLLPFEYLSKIQTTFPKECHAFNLIKQFISAYERGSDFSVYDFIKQNNALKYFGAELVLDKQEDAHEFLNQFLQRIEEEREKYCPYELCPFVVSHDARVFCNSCNKSNSHSPNISDEQIVCVDIGTDFDVMVKNSIKNKIDDYKCGNCFKLNNTASSKGLFVNISDYLVICFKRFSLDKFWQSKKLTDEVKIEEVIKIHHESQDNKKYTNYELTSIVIHKGTVSGGHYYSYVKLKGQWFEANDTRTRLVTFKDVIQDAKNNNYIHVYQKIKV